MKKVFKIGDTLHVLNMDRLAIIKLSKTDNIGWIITYWYYDDDSSYSMPTMEYETAIKIFSEIESVLFGQYDYFIGGPHSGGRKDGT